MDVGAGALNFGRMRLVLVRSGRRGAAALLAGAALAGCSTSRRDAGGALDEPSQRSSCSITLGPSSSEKSAPDGAAAGSGAAGAPSPAGSGDDFASGVGVSLHPKVNTVLVVSWQQRVAADSVFLEFSFEAGSVLRSPPRSGHTGPHQEVVLGVPGETPVQIRVVSRRDGVDHPSAEIVGTTGAVPRGLPTPEIVSFDPELASPDRWLLGSVEDSDGGCSNQSCYYHATFWLYIMDRQGRVVWYYADPATNATSSFQRVARDGAYLWIEKRPFGRAGYRGVLKLTLDWTYCEEVTVPRLSDAIDVTDDGSLLYDVTGAWELRELDREGQIRSIWSCPDHFGPGFHCYSNTINWNPADDTVLLSFPYRNTVVQVDRQSGAVVGQYGSAPGSYAFEPAPWNFEFQHFANITPDGTLLVSAHLPGNPETEAPIAGQHAFEEFTIDRDDQRLVQKWIYTEGPEWAMYKGMAIRLPNGNTLANYGTGGVIREITPDKRTAFEVKFDVPEGNDFFNKMVGHNVLIDDLYALNGGGPE